MSKFTFDANIFSDLYKETYGTRPHGHWFYNPSCSDKERQKIWDDLCAAHEREMDRYNAELAEAEKSFEAQIQDAISLGAPDRKTAIRWVSEPFRDQYMFGADYILYEFNLPYHKYRVELKDALGA